MKLFDGGGFVFGQDFGEVFLDAKLFRDPGGHPLGVAGEHSDALTHGMEGGDGFFGLVADNVG